MESIHSGQPSPGLRSVMGVRSSDPRSSDHRCEAYNCDIAWEESGDPAGQVIVCLHTAGSGGREFRPLTEQPIAGIRLIVLDWPGHGRSSDLPSESGQNFSVEFCMRILHTVLTQLGIDRPILLGSGFGAAVAIRFAAHYPTRTRGLILVNPAGLFSPIWTPLSFWKKLTRRIQALTPGRPLTRAQRQIWRAMALQSPTQDTLASALISLESSNPLRNDLRDTLTAIPRPIFFAFSREHRAYPLDAYLTSLDTLLRGSPQHRFTAFAGSVSPIWDEPARFAKAVTSFTRSLMPLTQHVHAWMLTDVDWPTRGSNLWKCIHQECNSEKLLAEGQDANAAGN